MCGRYSVFYYSLYSLNFEIVAIYILPAIFKPPVFIILYHFFDIYHCFFRLIFQGNTSEKTDLMNLFDINDIKILFKVLQMKDICDKIIVCFNYI